MKTQIDSHTDTPAGPPPAVTLASLDRFTRAYLITALWSSSDRTACERKAALDAGYTVHSELVGDVIKWVHVAPGENGADFIHETDSEETAWRDAAECAGTVTDGNLDNFFDLSDFAPDTLAKCAADCAKFQADNAATIQAAIDTGEVKCGPDFDETERAGHDFWLTRCGHGCGFWDGDWPKPYSDKLTAAAKAFGNVDLYVGDDGAIHL